MKCPKCARTIRSKHQCAYCGSVFNKEAKTPEAVVPKTKKKKRKGGVFPIIFGVIKIALLLVSLILLFLYVPKYFGNIMNFINPSSKQETVQSSVEESAVESTESDSVAVETTEEKSQLTLINKEVDLDDYPAISVKLEFEQLLEEVGRDTFEFAIKNGSERTTLTNYSLEKDGKLVTLRFNDPRTVTTPAEKEQTIEVFASSLNFTNTITYELPKLDIDAEVVSAVNGIVGQLPQAKVVSLAYSDGKATPVYSSNESVEASTVISWFILNRTYELLEQGKIKGEDMVKIESELVAKGDEGTTASEVDTEVSVEALIVRVIQHQDVTAMNHLIKVIGGADSFNMWLKEHHYFSTMVTATLSVESGNMTGAKTSAQDLTKLLTLLSQNKLISPTQDIAFKQALLQTPFTDKYPNNLSVVTNRFEIATPDVNAMQQHYAGILAVGEKSYVIVVLLDGVSDTESAVTSIASTISDVMTKVAKAQTDSEQVTTNEEDAETATPQVQPTYTEPVNTQPSYTEPTYTEPTYTEPTEAEGTNGNE